MAGIVAQLRSTYALGAGTLHPETHTRELIETIRRMCVDVVKWSPLAEDAPEYTAEQMHATIQGVAFEEKVELNLA